MYILYAMCAFSIVITLGTISQRFIEPLFIFALLKFSLAICVCIENSFVEICIFSFNVETKNMYLEMRKMVFGYINRK